MNLKIIQYKEDIYEGFWFLPFAITFSIITLFFLSLYGDHLLFKLFPDAQLLQLKKDSITTIFSVIGTAIVAIISVTFSITVLTLSIASSQLGQRLLPHFMKQKQTQIILGFYTGSFIYSLLTILSFSVKSPYVTPSLLSAKIGVLLGIICVFILVYFIHFVCHSIQIDNVLLLLSKEIKTSINRQFKSSYDNAFVSSETIYNNTQQLDKFEAISICADKSGYIQAIDIDSLLHSAKCFDLIIKIHVNPGEFILKSTTLLTAYKKSPKVEIDNTELCNAFHTGIRRTSTHDTGFGFEQISEIALRALSPGINAPYTAVHCIDRIFDGFTILIDKKPLPRLYKGKDGELRVINSGYDFKQLVDDSLNKIRQAASNDVLVSLYMIKIIHKSLKLNYGKAMKEALFNQAKMTYESISKEAKNDSDKNDIQDYFECLRQDYLDNR